MNELAKIQPEKATLVEIRTDNRAFPRLHTYRREEAVAQMNIILLMAFQFRGQQADVATITQMSASLTDILNEDEYGIGTKFLSFEEIKRVVRRSALGQGREMYGISVSSVYQALADYCRNEGRAANQEARQIAEKKREMRMAVIAPMLQGYSEEITKKSESMYERISQTQDKKAPAGNKGSFRRPAKGQEESDIEPMRQDKFYH